VSFCGKIECMNTPQVSTQRSDFPLDTLIAAALAVRERAYCPFSNYAVGAALFATNGTIFTGCNVENSAYPATICAERSAVVKAISEGVREFSAVVVATEDGGSPCGTCRQVMYEFAPDMLVIAVDRNGAIKFSMALRDLLPHGFRFNATS
jgi:cytidine deaminase